MNTRDQTRAGGSTKRRASVAVAALGWLLAGPACAADLPADLLRAAMAMPETPTGRKRCAEITGNYSDGRPADERGYSGEPAPYTLEVHGVYLAQITAGIAAGPFVEALLDAGAAKRLRTVRTIRERVLNPTSQVPLRDLGTAGDPPPLPPPTVVRETVIGTDVFVVEGADERFFSHDGTTSFGWPPPPVASGGIPQGLSNASRFCWTWEPERVLEYAGPQSNGNGVTIAAARILVRAQLPGWITDPRVIDVLRPNPAPQEVVELQFRDDGDGWRAEGTAFSYWERQPWHILEPDLDGPQ